MMPMNFSHIPLITHEVFIILHRDMTSVLAMSCITAKQSRDKETQTFHNGSKHAALCYRGMCCILYANISNVKSILQVGIIKNYCLVYGDNKIMGKTQFPSQTPVMPQLSTTGPSQLHLSGKYLRTDQKNFILNSHKTYQSLHT